MLLCYTVQARHLQLSQVYYCTVLRAVQARLQEEKSQEEAGGFHELSFLKSRVQGDKRVRAILHVTQSQIRENSKKREFQISLLMLLKYSAGFWIAHAFDELPKSGEIPERIKGNTNLLTSVQKGLVIVHVPTLKRKENIRD